MDFTPQNGQEPLMAELVQGRRRHLSGQLMASARSLFLQGNPAGAYLLRLAETRAPWRPDQAVAEMPGLLQDAGHVPQVIEAQEPAPGHGDLVVVPFEVLVDLANAAAAGGTPPFRSITEELREDGQGGLPRLKRHPLGPLDGPVQIRRDLPVPQLDEHYTKAAG